MRRSSRYLVRLARSRAACEELRDASVLNLSAAPPDDRDSACCGRCGSAGVRLAQRAHAAELELAIYACATETLLLAMEGQAGELAGADGTREARPQASHGQAPPASRPRPARRLRLDAPEHRAPPAPDQRPRPRSPAAAPGKGQLPCTRAQADDPPASSLRLTLAVSVNLRLAGSAGTARPVQLRDPRRRETAPGTAAPAAAAA